MLMNDPDQKGAGAKRQVFTKRGLEQLEAVSPYLTVEQIADHFGISRRSFFNIRDRQPEVQKAYGKGKSKAIKMIAENLVTKALDGNLSAQIFYLKTQAGWRETNRHEIAADSEQGPTEIVIRSVKSNNGNSSSGANS